MIGDSRPRKFLPTVLAYLCVLHSIRAHCPPGWTSWRDSCYILLENKLTWDEALRVCGRPKSGLAVPNSVDENDVINQMQREACAGGNSCGLWIGCELDRNLELMTCIDQKQAPSFDYWRIRIDTSSEEDEVNCGVFMSNSNGGKWQNDATACTSERFVMCEMPRQIHVYSLTMSALDGRVPSRCLHGHEIKNTPVNGVIECGAACWAEPRCRSFNLWQGGPHKICQLNNATILESDDEDVSSSDKACYYFGL